MFISQNLDLQKVANTYTSQYIHVEVDFISEIYPKSKISFQETAFSRTLLAIW